MVQAVDTPSEPAATSARVAALRAELRRQGLDGFIIPRQDEFQGDSVAPYAERLRWLTGFAGSWGTAIVLPDRAAIFVDGRYTIQVREQVNLDLFTPLHLIDEPPPAWLEKNLTKGQVIGYDPWLLTGDQVQRYERAVEKAGATLKAAETSPVDAVWTEQPSRPGAPIETQPTQFAGRSSEDKLAEIARSLEAQSIDAAILTLPDSVSWLFNIRGRDVPFTPVVLAQAIVHRTKKADLFVDPKRIPEDVADHLAAVATVHTPDRLIPLVEALGKAKAKVLLDAVNTPERIRGALKLAGAEIVQGPDPCVLPKARKNAIEQEGMRAAHRRDGSAMARFLHWLEITAPKGGLTEIAVAEKLEDFRQGTGALRDLSFEAIAGAGPHAALPHYHVNRGSDRKLGANEIFLIDSGGQYQDGTTDITRTVIVGEPTAEMKDRFTRVLKGMIAVSTVRFPVGTTGSQIDILARQALWVSGRDYDHGTGHGVGSYLSVHEGPARINKSDRTPLEPGMILSNEPGYYKEGAYGIRIENLILVEEARDIAGGERQMMGFETLTLCPIDRRLIAVGLLRDDELKWLNDYHARVAREIGPLLSGDDVRWLHAATAPISR
jgi:Xaa-Pro aminopeptidase